MWYNISYEHNNYQYILSKLYKIDVAISGKDKSWLKTKQIMLKYRFTKKQ